MAFATTCSYKGIVVTHEWTSVLKLLTVSVRMWSSDKQFRPLVYPLVVFMKNKFLKCSAFDSGNL